MTWTELCLAGAIAAVLSGLATWPLLALLRHRQVLDRPNERSSHQRPTPRGGGLAIVGVALAVWLGWLALSNALTTPVLGVILLAAALMAVSFVDDLRGLPVIARLAVQICAVAAGLWLLDADVLVFQGLLPPILDRLATAVAWLWFINLFNFMDGIDGIAGVEAVSIGVGCVLVTLLTADDAGWRLPAAIIAGAALGFLPWNWQPARTFMGDAGSVSLGFLLGWLLIQVAASGAWAAAFLLPLVFVADATVTLMRRLVKGEAIWRAHRSHFYQRAARATGSHARVTLTVLYYNVALIALAVWSTRTSTAAPIAMAIGVAMAALLLWYFASLQHRGRNGN